MTTSKAATPRTAHVSPSFIERIAYVAADCPAGVAALVKPTSLTKVAALVGAMFEGAPFPDLGAMVTALCTLEKSHPAYFLDIRAVMARRPTQDKYLSRKP